MRNGLACQRLAPDARPVASEAGVLQAAAAWALAVPWAPGAAVDPPVAGASPALAALCGERQKLEPTDLVVGPAGWPVRGEAAPAAVAVLRMVQAGHEPCLHHGISGLPA